MAGCCAERCWTTSGPAQRARGWHRHVLSTDPTLTRTRVITQPKTLLEYSPSGLPFIIFAHFKAEILPEPPLSRVYLKAAYQGLGSCLPGLQWRAIWEDYACGSALSHLLNRQSCLTFPRGTLSTERKNSPLVSESHREQDKPTRGKKKEEIERASFAGSFCRHLASVVHLCPACGCCQKFSAPPKSVLEEVVSLRFGDTGHRQELENSHGLQELQLYLPMV